MSQVTVARLVLAFAGVGLFFWSTRGEHDTLRWIAIGVIAVSLLLRFAEKRPPGRDARHGPSI